MLLIVILSLSLSLTPTLTLTLTLTLPLTLTLTLILTVTLNLTLTLTLTLAEKINDITSEKRIALDRRIKLENEVIELIQEKNDSSERIKGLEVDMQQLEDARKGLRLRMASELEELTEAKRIQQESSFDQITQLTAQALDRQMELEYEVGELTQEKSDLLDRIRELEVDMLRLEEEKMATRLRLAAELEELTEAKRQEQHLSFDQITQLTAQALDRRMELENEVRELSERIRGLEVDMLRLEEEKMTTRLRMAAELEVCGLYIVHLLVYYCI